MPRCARHPRSARAMADVKDEDGPAGHARFSPQVTSQYVVTGCNDCHLGPFCHLGPLALSCGAACLRMVLAALGVSQDEATIARHCGLTPLGCTVQDLVVAAQALGFHAGLLPVSSE